MEQNKKKHIDNRIRKKKYNRRDKKGRYCDLKTHQNVNRNTRRLIRSNMANTMKKKDYDTINYIVPNKQYKKSKTWWDCVDWTYRPNRQHGIRYKCTN
jgi:hypothetical protein